MTAAVAERAAPMSVSMARSACGGLALELYGARATFRPSGALWLKASKTLVVADLHFEKGSAYGSRGQHLPPYDTRETLGRLEAEVERSAPRTLVFLGDSFHDRKAEARLDGDDARRIEALASGRTLVWAVGNHDADGPQQLPGEVVDSLDCDGLNLVHEPGPGARPGEVAGHLHPAAKVVAYGRSVRSRCFLTDGERVVLPAFGAYAGGLNVRDRAFDGLFSRPPVACALGRGRVHALKWSGLSGD